MLTEKFNTSDSDLESLIAAPITKHSSNLKYKCEFKNCDKTFKRQTHLDRHEYHHNGIKKHSCLYDDCDKSYIISTHLKRHIQTFHEKFRKPKTFKCNVANCEKYFDSLFNVERHFANAHNNIKTYVCKECNKEFSRKLELKRHEIKDHKAEYPYKCKVCEKGYIQEVHLKNHKCLVKEPQYKCETCNEAFEKWSVLLEHTRNQHNKAFTCNCCGKEFQRKIDIENHEKSMKRKQENEGLKIKCPYENCDRTYNFQKNLKHHIKVKHLCKRFDCPFDECDKQLASKQKLNQHIKKIHETKTNSDKPKKDSTKKKNRKIRKDCGISKKSIACQLSNVVTNNSLQKKIINNELELTESIAKDSDVSFSEAENDEKIAGNVVILQ